MNQFESNEVCGLVPKMEKHSVRGTQSVQRNKFDGNSVLTRNKTKLVAQGYNQEEGTDFEETFAQVARFEVQCCLHLPVTWDRCTKCFLNRYIMEEIYVEQPPDFGDKDSPNHVYQLNKALYVLKQALRAWYEA